MVVASNEQILVQMMKYTRLHFNISDGKAN